MERSEVLDAMGQLKLYGMRTAYDEIITSAVKRQHEPQQIIGDLLTAEISEKQARSIKYQMTIAKLPLAKEIEEFDFEAAEVNETLIRDLATGDFLDHQRNLVLIPWPTDDCKAIGERRGDRHRQDPSRRQSGPGMHPPGPTGSVLQWRRSGEQARRRSPRRTPRAHCRFDLPARLPDLGRTWLSSVRTNRRATPFPSDQQAL